MTSKILMEEMTWDEIQKAISEGENTVIVAVGSMEQHGPHLPVCTDTLLAYEIAARVARKMGSTLVAPVIRPGFSLHHMEFAGTITLRSETLAAVIRDYCTSLAHHGFKNIIFICCHGGNRPTMQMVCTELANEIRGANVILVSDPFLYLPKEEVGEILGQKAGFHANEAETSMMLVLRKDLVKMEKAVRELPEFAGLLDVSYFLMRPLRALTKSGVLGDPTNAREGLGEKIFDTMCSNMVKDLFKICK